MFIAGVLLPSRALDSGLRIQNSESQDGLRGRPEGEASIIVFLLPDIG